MEQTQSLPSNVEGAANEGERDLAVLVNDEEFDELETALASSANDVNATNEAGETALHIACDRGFSPAIQLLVKHGASVTAASEDGTTPLHMLMCAEANGENISCID